MKDIIECPYCKTPNSGFSEVSSKEEASYSCFKCNEEIWENIPNKLLVYEALYFLLNVLFYSIIIFVTANFFEIYPEWRKTTGFFFILVVTLASLSLHEFFHSFFAFIFGDFSIYRKKYLRLNIFEYNVGDNSFLLNGIIFLFSGLALLDAAVYVNEHLIKKPTLYFIVNISGIFSQLIFLSVILFILHSEIIILGDQFIPLLHCAAVFQLFILIYNLLPLPGTDGWHAIFCFLPFEDLKNSSYNYTILIVLLFFAAIIWIDGLALFIFQPFSDLIKEIGIDFNLFIVGFKYFQLLDFDTLALLRDRIVDLFLSLLSK